MSAFAPGESPAGFCFCFVCLVVWFFYVNQTDARSAANVRARFWKRRGRVTEALWSDNEVTMRHTFMIPPSKTVVRTQFPNTQIDEHPKERKKKTVTENSSVRHNLARPHNEVPRTQRGDLSSTQLHFTKA